LDPIHQEAEEMIRKLLLSVVGAFFSTKSEVFDDARH
jgi:hypothetical protein